MESKIEIILQNFQQLSINNPILLDLLKNEQIILGQEITTEAKARLKIIESIEKQFNYKIYVGLKTNKINLVTFIPGKYKNDVKKSDMFWNGRALLTSIHLKNKKNDLVNTNGPAHNSAPIYYNFSEEYFNKVNSLDKPYLIGDWNVLLKENMCSQTRPRQHLHKSK